LLADWLPACFGAVFFQCCTRLLAESSYWRHAQNGVPIIPDRGIQSLGGHSVAAIILLFGFQSGAAFATIAGVLIEVSVNLCTNMCTSRHPKQKGLQTVDL